MGEAGPVSAPSRRRFLASIAASLAGAVATTAIDRARAASSPPAPLRMAWPWPVRAPDPYAANDLVASLLGVSLYPPLWVRAIDGYLEPRLALGAPKEQKLGVRVDLVPYVRPADVVASIARARTGGARLWLRDVPVPRVDGLHGVLFPFVGDIDGLMRRLATPMAGIARVEPQRLLPTGPFDLALDPGAPKGAPSDPTAPHVLRLRRRNVWGAPVAPLTIARRVHTFELRGAVELAVALHQFERGDTDVSWLGDGLFGPRPGARTIDLGPLAYLAIRAGKDAPEHAHPGGVLGLVESIAADRIDHLGLLRRGHVAPSRVPAFARAAPTVRSGLPILVRASHPMLVGAAEIVARELGARAAPVDDATMDKALADGTFALALEIVRPIDDTPDGATVALATFDRAAVAPAAGTTPHTLATAGSAALGWEIALIGAEAGRVWIPRAAFGGLDLEGGGEA